MPNTKAIRMGDMGLFLNPNKYTPAYELTNWLITASNADIKRP